MVSWTEAQAAVIGSGLIDGSVVPEILNDTRPEDYSGEYRRFYEAFAALSADGTPVDRVTVTGVLGSAYADMAMELSRLTPTSANVSAYIAVCKEQSRLELLKRCGAELAGAATLEDARAVIATAAGVSLETGRRTGRMASECFAEWFDALNRGEKPEFLDVGIQCLNENLMITPGNYIVVAGYTGSGKTALGLQMALRVSKTRKVGFFSYEMTRMELIERLISLISRVDYKRIQTGDLSDEELRYCSRVGGALEKSQLKIEECPNFTLEDIRSITVREEYQAVFVDYLQYVASSDRRADTLRRVSEASMGLKQMAQGLKIPVFAMSQLSRAEKSADEFTPYPQLRDLRESGQIEQDANAVLFVHAPFPRSMKGFRTLYIAKNRKNVTDSFHYTFLGACQLFRPPTEKEAASYNSALEEERKKSERRKSKNGAAPSEYTPLEDVKPGDVPFEQGMLPL